MAALANLVVPPITGESSVSEQVAEHQRAQQRLYSEPGHLGTVLRARARSNGGKRPAANDQTHEVGSCHSDHTTACQMEPNGTSSNQCIGVHLSNRCTPCVSLLTTVRSW